MTHVPGAGAPSHWSPDDMGSQISPNQQPLQMQLPRQARPDYGMLGKMPQQQMIPHQMSQDSPSGSGSYVSPCMSPHHFAPDSRYNSSSGEFPVPAQMPMSMPQPQFGSLPPPMMQVRPNVPSEVLESLRAEAMAQAESVIAQRRAEYERQAHLARVRVVELEKRVKEAEADGDQMNTRLTVVEVQKAEAEQARAAAETKLQRVLTSNYEAQRVCEMEQELDTLRRESEDTQALKNTVMVLAAELKRRMKEDEGSPGTQIASDKEWLDSEGTPSDTDYVTDSRSGSDTE